MRNKKSQAVLARLKQITGTRTDAALSSALKISPQTLSSWKGRDSTPYSICVELAQTKGISLDWLLLGEGPMLRPLTDDCVDVTPERTLQEDAVLALWRRLKEEDRVVVQSVLEDKRRLRDLELKLEQMSATLSALQQSDHG
ncbi:helix-turn-helix domain-containing protein [Pseudomonas mandelii]|uniref:helix-turn-helix domain-containing protein n=1 Tax=Pseudomonas mandelii TaxID=75612 RepID=UPI00224A4E4C|nr:helix-turn-helix domain-containing protein [Pseudomonas mandelii]MCX2898262.1 helix-turn-helix domain-containing protein [Pseudomonas mandelii]